MLQVWKSSLNIDPVELADAGRFFQQSRRWDCIWAVLPHLLIFTRYRCRVDFDISPTRWLFNLSHFLCKLLFNQTNMQLILYKPFFRRWERFCDQKNFYVREAITYQLCIFFNTVQKGGGIKPMFKFCCKYFIILKVFFGNIIWHEKLFKGKNVPNWG